MGEGRGERQRQRSLMTDDGWIDGGGRRRNQGAAACCGYEAIVIRI